jgi:GTP-binding protein
MVDPATDAMAIVEELRNYDESLFQKPRWIVLNKIDLIPEAEREERIRSLLLQFQSPGVPAFAVSAVSGEGCVMLCRKIMQYLEGHPAHA